MAGLGFKDFQVGEVLTSSDVDGYLMQQTVMRFADAGARGSALGTATGTAVALAEGMVSYLDDANRIEVYNGTGWVATGGFSASTAITTTDATWTVPTLADPVVKVTVIGGGGGGGSRQGGTNGGAGGNTSFACSAGTATASGGAGGQGGELDSSGSTGTSYGIGGGPGKRDSVQSGTSGRDGEVRIAYLDMTGVSTANVTIGAGGSGGSVGGATGGPGAVFFEYRAG